MKPDKPNIFYLATDAHRHAQTNADKGMIKEDILVYPPAACSGCEKMLAPKAHELDLIDRLMRQL